MSALQHAAGSVPPNGLPPACCHARPAHLSRLTSRCVQNLALALTSIAFLAVPMLLGRIPLWIAVVGHEGSTLLVALNCLRLLRNPQAAPASPGGLRTHAMPAAASAA